MIETNSMLLKKKYFVYVKSSRTSYPTILLSFLVKTFNKIKKLMSFDNRQTIWVLQDDLNVLETKKKKKLKTADFVIFDLLSE